jgi:hypothetical protein
MLHHVAHIDHVEGKRLQITGYQSANFDFATAGPLGIQRCSPIYIQANRVPANLSELGQHLSLAGADFKARFIISGAG